jgi:hypothetical protein
MQKNKEAVPMGKVTLIKIMRTWQLSCIMGLHQGLW